MRLLVTKKISLAFKERLLHHGFSVIDFPFISIKPLPFTLDNIESHLIFTSQNAVRILLQESQLTQKKCFCVGEKTKLLLEENGQKVIKMAQNSSELAHFLIKNYKNERFSFFCGKRRMPDLEMHFKTHEMALQVIPIYETLLNPHRMDAEVAGILFYSPSAVESFFMENKWPQKAYGFCLGNSTADALKAHTSQYYVALQPNESALLVQLKKHFSTYA